jgi:glycosyltransferase involved in cell wall biosynthesis
MLADHAGKTIGIIPDVRGLGGPASFHQKFAAGLSSHHINVTYDLNSPQLNAVLVIAGSKHLNLLRQVRNRGIPIIQRLDGMNWVHRRRYTGVKHYLRSEINNWILQTIRKDLATSIIYQSRFSQEWWFRVYGEVNKPTRVVYNGIDLGKYRPSFSEPALSPIVRLLAVEGHLKNGVETGLINVVQALRHWPDYNGIPIRLAVAGEVPTSVRNSIEKMLPARIDWLGVLPREKIPEEMHRSHLLFSAELNPPCPNALIESLACGLPVLAFDSGAIRELIDNSCGGILPYDANIWKLEMADGSLLPFIGGKVLDDLSAYRRDARRRAEQLFDLEEMVHAYLETILG